MALKVVMALKGGMTLRGIMGNVEGGNVIKGKNCVEEINGAKGEDGKDKTQLQSSPLI